MNIPDDQCKSLFNIINYVSSAMCSCVLVVLLIPVDFVLAEVSSFVGFDSFFQGTASPGAPQQLQDGHSARCRRLRGGHAAPARPPSTGHRCAHVHDAPSPDGCRGRCRSVVRSGRCVRCLEPHQGSVSLVSTLWRLTSSTYLLFAIC